MTTAGLSHINFRADRPLLDALKEFYCNAVGLKVGQRPPFPFFGYWLYAGDLPIVHLSLAAPGEERRTHVPTSFDHVAFNCANRAEVEARLQSLAVPYRTAIVPLTRQVQLFLQDPGGNHVELNFAEPDAEVSDGG